MDFPKKILMVEDDAEMRALFRDFFREEGFEIEMVSNGSEALRRVAREAYALILTDLRLPGLTGLDLLPGIKKLRPDVPVIVLSAFGSEENRKKALQKGATIYLEKPFHLNTLREILQEILSPSRRVGIPEEI